MNLTPIYEIYSLEDRFCYVDSIQLNEYDNSNVLTTGYTYSGLTMTLNLNDFTPHFDTTGHTYINVILNDDIYEYIAISGESHFFTIYNFYSGSTPYVDPRLSGVTPSNVVTGFTTSITGCTELLAGLTGVCCPTESILDNLPWIYQTDHGTGTGNCNPFIQRRPISGWTIDYVFNRRGLPWEDVVELIKTAPGERALALYKCAYQGLIPWEEAIELIKSAPGDRAGALYWCARALVRKAKIKEG